MTLNERIKERRKELGYGLRTMAALANISPAFLVDIEAGARRPGPGVLAELANVLRLPLSELQGLDPRVTPEVKAWMDSEPRVAAMLARLCAHPDRDKVMRGLEEVLR